MFECGEIRSFIQSSACETSDGMSETEEFGFFFFIKGLLVAEVTILCI